MRWIECQSLMPMNRDNVQAIVNGEVVDNVFWDDVVELWGIDYGGYDIVAIDDQNSVTHWRPYPKQEETNRPD